MGRPEEEKRRKKEAEEYWKRILAYYMMEQTRITQEQVEELMESPFQFFHEIREQIREGGILGQLLEKDADGLSAMDRLMELDLEDEADVPFRELLEEARKEKPSEEKLADAMTKVVTQAPAKLLERAKAENAKRAARVLLPKDDFAALVDRANDGLEPKVKAEDFSIEPTQPRKKEDSLVREVEQAGPLFQE